MKALAVIEDLDVIEDGRTSLAMGEEIVSVNKLDFEGAPEAFHGGVIITVGPAAHGGWEIGLMQGGSKIRGTVLNTPVAWKST